MPCRRKLISEAKIERRSIYAAYTERKRIAKGSQGSGEALRREIFSARAAANDEQLSQLLNYLGGVEQRHLDIITKIDSGEIPQPAAGEAAPKMISSRPIRSAKRRKRRTTAISVPICSPQKSTPPRSMTPASSSSRTNSSERFSTPSSARSRSTARKYMTICPRTICIRETKRPSLGAVFT